MSAASEKKYFVLMGNDYPDAILIGTEEQAEAEAKRRMAEQEEHARKKERLHFGRELKSYSPRVYWRVYEYVPKDLSK